jgi:hypothetical protein
MPCYWRYDLTLMSTLTDIQEAITQLSPSEQQQLARWFEEELEDAWDAQIQEDAKSGKLDQLHDQLKKEHGDNPMVSLDDFLDDKKLS